MPAQIKGMLVGGLLPALLFGLAGVLQKAVSRTGGGGGPYLIFVGAGVLVCGVAATALGPDRSWNWRSGMLAGTIGLSWSLGMLLVLVAMVKFRAPLAKLAPLYNMNPLIVSVLALVLFAEAREVAVVRLLAGAVLIVAGGILVARA